MRFGNGLSLLAVKRGSGRLLPTESKTATRDKANFRVFHLNVSYRFWTISFLDHASAS